jgi:XTP/dITP diphosphohydrolase
MPAEMPADTPLPVVLLATGNQKKGLELRDLCAGQYHVKTLADVGLGDIDVVEDAPDFAGNARKKALEVCAAVKAAGNVHGVSVVVADDSGLAVDALDGRPGVRSARFSADAGYAPAGRSVDAANVALLLVMLAPLPPERRAARFVCAVCAVDVNSGAVVAEADGAVFGRIATDEVGDGGFGYDPIFIVDDAAANAAAGVAVNGLRMAELSAAHKHAISHRGRAMRALLAKLSPQAGAV